MNFYRGYLVNQKCLKRLQQLQHHVIEHDHLLSSIEAMQLAVISQ